jgi:hypothetical protein
MFFERREYVLVDVKSATWFFEYTNKNINLTWKREWLILLSIKIFDDEIVFGKSFSKDKTLE